MLIKLPEDNNEKGLAFLQPNLSMTVTHDPETAMINVQEKSLFELQTEVQC